MATTSNTYTGNGSNKLFSITFPYLDTTDIDVYLNGTLQTVTTQYTFANATTIEFVTAPGNGSTVLLSRSTNDTTLQATFFPGSSIKAADLNDNFDQVLYIAQETANSAANQSTAGLQAQITAATNTANTAITTANAANSTANGIAGTANTALANSNTAVSTANAAQTTANAAQTTANAAQIIANAAMPFSGGTFTGNINVPSLNGGPIAGTRNRIINGDMRIDQRNAGAAQTVSAAAYTLDRWFIDRAGGTVTAQRVGSIGAYSLQITGGAGVTSCVIFQRIESLNVGDLADQTVTLSAVLSSTSQPTLGVYYQIPTATDNYASVNQTTITAAQAITSTATRYYWTFTLPSTANRGLQIIFSTGTFTSGTVTVTNVQLEPGSVATPFERRSCGQELALCQRYYEKSYDIGTAPGASTTNGFLANGGFYSGATAAYGTRVGTQYKVTKRATPTVTTYDSVGGSGKCNYPDAATGATMTVITNGESGFTAETAQVSSTQTRCYWHYTSSAEL